VLANQRWRQARPGRDDVEGNLATARDPDRVASGFTFAPFRLTPMGGCFTLEYTATSKVLRQRC
jgi:hypothetical protein